MSADRDQRVDEAIAEYLAACDTGNPQDQKEFLAKYPDLADNLRSFFGDHARMQRVTGAHSNATKSLNLGIKNDEQTVSHQPESTSDTIGELFGYRILDELGDGGQGVVYRAYQVGLKREVALKRIRTGAAARAGTLSRFWTEAESLGRLRHPNIVQVYDFGREGGEPYLCMELLTGGSLADRLKKGPLPARDAAKLVQSLALAVQAAHDAGVIHRDPKPSNILFDTAGVPKLADFGLAKLHDADGSLPFTEEGTILGTFAYMSPEQATGLRVTGQVDIHALGLVLYETLTGRRPFQCDQPGEILPAVINHTPEPLSSVLPGCPRDLDIVCQRCLEKSPADRYPSARELAEDLGRWLQGKSVTPPSLTQRLKHWAVHKPALAANLCAVLVFYVVYLINRYLIGLSDPENRFHNTVNIVALVWVAGAALCQRLLEKPRWVIVADYGWTMLQVVLVTILLWAGKGPASGIVFYYPLLVCGAALSGKARLSWYTAAIAAIGYTAITFHTWWFRPEDRIPPTDSVVYVAMLFLVALIQYLILRRSQFQ
jgi:serine/threonine-protein kinase